MIIFYFIDLNNILTSMVEILLFLFLEGNFFLMFALWSIICIFDYRGFNSMRTGQTDFIIK